MGIAQLFEWGIFSEIQLDVINGLPARINLLDGSVRSGKTVCSLVAWINFVREAPAGNLMMIGKTERTLKRNIIDPLLQMVGPKNLKTNYGNGEIFLFGRMIYIGGANDERAEIKVRGITLVGLYGDELTLWPESLFKMCLSRLSISGAKLLGTTNPDSPYHWLNQDYLIRASELNLKRWHFTLDDNYNLDSEFVRDLKNEYTGLWYKRFIDGLWVMAEGSVYDMWDEDRHVYRKLKSSQEINSYIVAIDYGTSNVMTFGLYGFNNRESKPKVHLVDEFYYDAVKKGRQRTDSQFADDFERFIDGYHLEAIYCDPSAASFKVELRHRGFLPRNADNDVISGIRFVSSMLYNGLFVVHEKCKDTRMEFLSYVWDEKKQKEYGLDEPLKKHDHAMDRNRYALYTHFKRLNYGFVDRPAA